MIHLRIRPGLSDRPGVTLAEFLVVVGIMAVLIALMLPAVQRVREAANRAQCAANLKEIALAVHAYHQVNNRIPYNQFGPYGGGPDSYAWSWLARLLPYIEQTNLYTTGQIPEQTLEQSGVISAQIPIFLCPSDNAGNGPRLDAGNLAGVAVGQTNYKGVSGANWGDDGEGNGGLDFPTFWRHRGSNGSFDGHADGDGMFYRMDYLRPLKLMKIGDGTSNTFMIGEDVPALDQWCSWPYANNATGTCAIPPNVMAPWGGHFPPWMWQNNESFRSQHRGGLQFAYADASVHFISNGIELHVYRALATINGGEIVSTPE